MSQFLANEALKLEVSNLHRDARTALTFAYSGDVAHTASLLRLLEQRIARLASNITIQKEN